MPSTRGKLLASFASVAVIAGVGSYGTFASFTDTTSNTGNTFTAGDLKITDSDNASTLFTLAADGKLNPGQTLASKCIDVTNSGDIDFDRVDLTTSIGGTAGGGTGDGLQDDLTVVVEKQTGAHANANLSCAVTTGWSPVYSGTLKNFTGDANDTTGWTVGSTKSYRFTVTLPQGAVQDAEADTATLGLTWTAQS